MDESPALKVDWECGEGSVHLGGMLRDAPVRFRYDVLSDWKDQIDHLLREAHRGLYPEQQTQTLHRQRAHNARRRKLCATLSGQTIEMVEPLVNGDLLLHLRSARTVVLYASHEDVKLDVVTDVSHARHYASQDNTGDYYVREESCEEDTA